MREQSSKDQSVTPLRPNLNVETKPTKFDRTNAALIAANILAGFLFAVMFCIWLSASPNVSVGDKPTWPLDPTGVKPPKGLTDEVLEPGSQEFPEVSTPDFAKTLLAVTDVVSTVPASLNKRVGNAERTGFGISLGHKRGESDPGPIGTPTYKRWSVMFEAEDIDAYSKQLDFFKIDVAAIHKSENIIWRVHQTDGGTKVIKSDRQKENKTLRFSHKRQRLRNWDKEICRRSGIDVAETINAQFYSDATSQIMAAIESAAASDAGRKVQEVRKTIFRIVPDGDEFQFEVVELEFH